jgi:hypothetical protein
METDEKSIDILKSMMYTSLRTNSTDKLSDCTQSGIYYCSGNQSDSPISNYGFLIVFVDYSTRINNAAIQFFIGVSNARIYYRRFAGTKWNDWATLL